MDGMSFPKWPMQSTCYGLPYQDPEMCSPLSATVCLLPCSIPGDMKGLETQTDCNRMIVILHQKNPSQTTRKRWQFQGSLKDPNLLSAPSDDSTGVTFGEPVNHAGNGRQNVPVTSPDAETAGRPVSSAAILTVRGRSQNGTSTTCDSVDQRNI